MRQLGNTQFLNHNVGSKRPLIVGKKATLPKYRVTLSHICMCEHCARHKETSLWSLFVCMRMCEISSLSHIIYTNFADFIVCGKNISRPRECSSHAKVSLFLLLSQFGWDNNWPLVRPPQRVYKSNKMQGRVRSSLENVAVLLCCCESLLMRWPNTHALAGGIKGHASQCVIVGQRRN